MTPGKLYKARYGVGAYFYDVNNHEQGSYSGTNSVIMLSEVEGVDKHAVKLTFLFPSGDLKYTILTRYRFGVVFERAK